MKNEERKAAELEGVVGGLKSTDPEDRAINLADCPNVTVDVEPI